jgi:hypothetical protein
MATMFAESGRDLGSDAKFDVGDFDNDGEEDRPINNMAMDADVVCCYDR